MKVVHILVLTNDYSDAAESRTFFKQWVEKNTGHKVTIASASNDTVHSEHKDVVIYGQRGVRRSNVKSIGNLIASTDPDVVIYRGIELVLLSPLIKRPHSRFFLLTGLGRLWHDDFPCKSLVRSGYRAVLKSLIALTEAKLILQNSQDAIDLRIKSFHLMTSSGVKGSPSDQPLTLGTRKKIITASRLTYAKGILDILEFAQIIQTKPDYSYDVYGNYDNLPEDLIKKIEHLNTSSSNIRFHGWIPSNAIDLKQFHFAYFPSTYREGSPRFLIESIKCGLVVVTKSAPGCDALVSLENGFQKESAIEAFKAVKTVSPTTFDTMSRNSQALFESNYAESVVYNNLIEFIIKNK